MEQSPALRILCHKYIRTKIRAQQMRSRIRNYEPWYEDGSDVAYEFRAVVLENSVKQLRKEIQEYGLA